MKQSRIFTRTILATAVALTSQQAFAAGFQLNAQSATGLGRAFAGDAVIADNASVMARNPAAMALFDKTEFSVGVNAISTDISVTDIEYTRPFGGGSIDDASNGGTTPVPNIYLVVPMNEKLALGAGVYSNFGTSNEFSDDFGRATGAALGPVLIPGADAFGGTTNVSSINIALAASYRLNSQWSIGGGLDIVYGTGELYRTSDFGALPEPAELLNVDAKGYGLGFNLGTVFELNENNRFGLAYHYSPTIEASGTVEYQSNDDIGDLILPLPSMLEFSGYHRINQTDFAVHYSVQWIGWSAFDKLETTDDVLIKDYEWQDGMHYAIGGTYYINKNWEARVGYMYDTSAQDEITSISVPDSDRQWFSAGASYHFSENNSLDFGVTYLVGHDVEVTDVLTEQVYVTATTRADAWLYGVQYSHRF
ncbi:aromatic hydrocarbon degradation protein [Vibrio sp. qd031]|uniref:OmpP1/FadL family transporter n=1 Tax=Vibrio sp. qd031 TaxID=1603038 RepID=UPI000A10F144|nr:outer membrane protein transport protein [Vibrio sp. qd031]ORT49394.1 aromatic hydrocarbon degradation protein [Vibrio sp. qd031]